MFAFGGAEDCVLSCKLELLLLVYILLVIRKVSFILILKLRTIVKLAVGVTLVVTRNTGSHLKSALCEARKFASIAYVKRLVKGQKKCYEATASRDFFAPTDHSQITDLHFLSRSVRSKIGSDRFVSEEFELRQHRLEWEEARARHEEELHEMRCSESKQEEQKNMLFQLAITGMMAYFGVQKQRKDNEDEGDGKPHAV
jgi:hypothetical protein